MPFINSKSSSSMKSKLEQALSTYLANTRDNRTVEDLKGDVELFAGIAATDSPFNYGSYFSVDKRQFTRSALRNMLDGIDVRGTPVYRDHQTNSESIGKVFGGEIQKYGDVSALTVYFWIDKTEDKIIQKMRSGTYREMSVSVASLDSVCSECGSAVNSDLHIGKCSNLEDPHDISGRSSAYIKLKKVSPMFELSVVSRGAVPDTDVSKIAASGLLNPETDKAPDKPKLMQYSADYRELTELTNEIDCVKICDNNILNNEDVMTIKEIIEESKELEVKVPLSQYNDLIQKLNKGLEDTLKLSEASSELAEYKVSASDYEMKLKELTEAKLAVETELESLKVYKETLTSLAGRLDLSETAPRDIAEKIVYLVNLDTSDKVTTNTTPSEEIEPLKSPMALSGTDFKVLSKLTRKI